jgi:hypothetical protein
MHVIVLRHAVKAASVEVQAVAVGAASAALVINLVVLQAALSVNFFDY